MTDSDTDTPLLHKQRRKLQLGVWVAVVLGLPMIYPGRIARLLGIDVWIPVAVFGLLFGATILMLARASNCPRCGVNLFWHGFAHAKYGNWLNWMLTQSVCPKCGYPHSKRHQR